MENIKRKNWMRVWACIGLVICLLTSVCLVGCDGQENPSSGDETDPVVTDTKFAVQYRTVTIALGTDAEAAIRLIGEPKNKQFVASCGEGVGDQWMYDYGSLILYTVKDGEAETVDAVVLRDDSAKTVDGVAIGDAIDNAVNTYGKLQKDGQKRRLTEGNHTMEFSFDENQKINGIELRVES